MIDQIYFPILRFRRAEKLALSMLKPKDKELITPVIEIVPPSIDFDSEDIDEKKLRIRVTNTIRKVGADIFAYWGYKNIILDISLIPKDFQSDSLDEILFNANTLFLNITPVISFNMSKDVIEIIKRRNITQNGICLRLFKEDIMNNNISKDIDELVNYLNYKKENVDILIDLKRRQSDSLKIDDILHKTPNILEWRNLILASGSFPRDLSGMPIGKKTIERLDWKSWLYEVNQKGLVRIPSYGDYTIQFPHFVQLKAKPKMTVSIRYTGVNSFVVMKGELIESDHTPGPKQWLIEAKLLTQQPEFLGENFSAGDAFISKKANDKNAIPGKNTDWLSASINHHLTLVPYQLSNLSY